MSNLRIFFATFQGSNVQLLLLLFLLKQTDKLTQKKALPHTHTDGTQMSFTYVITGKLSQ